MRVLGDDPETGLPVTLRDGRFGPFLQLGEASAEKGAEKPKRSSLPKGLAPSAVDLEKALKLLSLPREVARHPETGEPILANIGRYGPYVQHGKTYANLGKDDDVLEVGANRAIDLIVQKEQGGGRRPAQDPGRVIGTAPGTDTPITVKAGRYGAYVTDGEINATLPKGADAEAVTLDEALRLIAARREAGGGTKKKAGARKAPAKAAAKSSAKTPKAKTAKAEAADGTEGEAATPKPVARKAAAKAPATKTTTAKKAPAKKPAVKSAAGE